MSTKADRLSYGTAHRKEIGSDSDDQIDVPLDVLETAGQTDHIDVSLDALETDQRDDPMDALETDQRDDPLDALETVGQTDIALSTRRYL